MMKKLIFSVLILLSCLTGFAYAADDECFNQPIPKEYGRLVNVIGMGRSACLLFFEANDGTIRTVRLQVQDKTHYRVCKDNLNYTISRN
jgi:hypothetical protein